MFAGIRQQCRLAQGEFNQARCLPEVHIWVVMLVVYVSLHSRVVKDIFTEIYVCIIMFLNVPYFDVLLLIFPKCISKRVSVLSYIKHSIPNNWLKVCDVNCITSF